MAGPNIGYNPANYGAVTPATKEAWAATMATQWTAAWANGTESFGSQAFSNTFWQQNLGLGPLPAATQGASARNPNNAVPPEVYNGFARLADYLANNPEVAGQNGITVPNLPSTGEPIYDETTRGDLFSGAQNDANRQNNIDVANIGEAGATARANLAAQTQQAIAALQEAGATARSAAEIAGRLSIAQLQEVGANGRLAQQLAHDTQEGSLNRAHELAVVNLQESGMDRRSAEELANRLNIVTLQEAGQDRRLASQIAHDAQQGQLQREHETAEAALSREFQAGESQRQREFVGAESQRDRDLQQAIVHLQEGGLNERQARDLANRLTVTELQEAAANSRNAARIAADLEIANRGNETERYGIDVGAAVQREDIAARERISSSDRSSREIIAHEQETGLNRRFDLQIAEDRRQFNSEMGVRLLEMGIELSRRPVDWVAHQFWAESMSIPTGLNNLAAIAGLFGAIPPTGPSAAGPVTGGPAAMDGDTAMAEQAGVQAGFVGLQDAIQQNPGDVQNPLVGDLTAQATAVTLDSSVGMAAVEQQLAQARVETLPQIGENPVTQQGVQISLGQANPMQQQGETPLMDIPDVRADGTPPPPAPISTPPGMQDSTGGVPAPQSAFGGPSPYAQQAQPDQQQQPGIYVPPPAASATASAANPSAPGTGPETAQGTDMLHQLADDLGIGFEELQQALPANLLAQGYSRETLMQMPVIQALINRQSTLNGFRTAPVGPNDRFGNISAFGIPLQIRGGQDINAGLLLKGSDVNHQMIQGAVEGAGLDWNDTVRQSLKTAPVSSYQAGAFGRRRF